MHQAAAMPRTRRIETLPTKESRARARKSIGKLRHQVLSKKTEERYAAAFTAFRQFHKLACNFAIHNFEEFDDVVAEYIEFLWESGEPKSYANYTLAGIQFYRPQVKQHLPWSWKLAKIWNQVQVPVRATPLTPQVMLAFAGPALRWRQPQFAWLLVVAFALFLRTGELLQLAPRDVTLDGTSAIIFVQGSKGSKRTFLPLERLQLDEPVALQALKNLLHAHKAAKTTPFWGESRRSFMDTWHSVADHLALPLDLYKPYSLRRGGATSAYKNGVPLDVLVTKGRWQHVHTARIYLDTGLQALAAVNLPPLSRPRIQAATEFYRTVSQSGARGRRDMSSRAGFP